MATPFVQEEIDKLFPGNPFIGPKPQAIPPQAYGLGAGAPAQPSGIEGMTAADFKRQMELGSAGMSNVSALQKQAEMQPEYAKALRAVPGQHWTQQATRAMSGIGQGMAALGKEAMIKTAGDKQQHTLEKMLRPDTAGPAPEAATRMDMWKSKMPDFLRNWGGGS